MYLLMRKGRGKKSREGLREGGREGRERERERDVNSRDADLG